MSKEFLAYPDKIIDLAIRSTFVAIITKAMVRLRRDYFVDSKLNNDGLMLVYEVWSDFLGRDYSEEAALQDEMREQLRHLKYMCGVLCLLLCSVKIIKEMTPVGYSSRDKSTFDVISPLASEFFSLHVAYGCYRHFAYRITNRWPSSWFEAHDFEEFIGLCQVVGESLDVEGVFDQLVPDV